MPRGLHCSSGSIPSSAWREADRFSASLTHGRLLGRCVDGLDRCGFCACCCYRQSIRCNAGFSRLARCLCRLGRSLVCCWWAGNLERRDLSIDSGASTPVRCRAVCVCDSFFGRLPDHRFGIRLQQDSRCLVRSRPRRNGLFVEHAVPARSRVYTPAATERRRPRVARFALLDACSRGRPAAEPMSVWPHLIDQCWPRPSQPLPPPTKSGRRAVLAVIAPPFRGAASLQVSSKWVA